MRHLAAERLTALQRELRETQNQVFDASRELNKLEQDRTARKLSEADKQKIRQKLAAKIRKINQVSWIEIHNFISNDASVKSVHIFEQNLDSILFSIK